MSQPVIENNRWDRDREQAAVKQPSHRCADGDAARAPREQRQQDLLAGCSDAVEEQDHLSALSQHGHADHDGHRKQGSLAGSDVPSHL